MSTNKNVLSPLKHVPIADGSGNIAPHPHYSSTTHMDSQTLPTHSVLFLSLLIQTIFAMGRCCSLSTRSTCRNPRPTAPPATGTALPYTYSTSYPMLAFIYNILLPPPTCFSVPTPLTPVIVTLSAQCISTKLVLSVSCIYHWMSVYILCTSTKCRLCTTPVVSLPLLPHNPPWALWLTHTEFGFSL